MPASVSQYSLGTQILDASNVITGEANTNTFVFDSLPGKIEMQMQSLSSQIVGDSCNLQFTLKVANILPRDGQLRIKLPKWNPGTQNLDKVRSMIRISTTQDTFSVPNMGFIIDCTSVAHPALQCIFQQTQALQISQLAETYDSLLIQGFASAISAGGTLTFNLMNNRFINPPSTAPISEFSASTINALKQLIDATEIPASYQATIAANIDGQDFVVRPANALINSETTYDFTIKVPMPIPVGSTFVLTIPSEISIYSRSGQLLVTSAEGQSPLYKTLSLQLSNPTTQSLTLTNLAPTPSYQVDESSTILFTLFNLRNHRLAGIITGFALKVYNSQGYLIMSLDKSSTQAGVRVVSGTLAGLAVTPDNYRTRAQVSYAIRFNLVNPVGSGDGVQIQLPEAIEVVRMPLSVVGGNVARGAIVKYEQATRTIQITKCFDGEIAAGGMVSFSLKNLINPPTTETSGAIKVSTIDAVTGRKIDSDEVSAKITATANEIPSVTVTACSDPQVRTGSYTGQVCTYQVRIRLGPDLSVKANSLVEIDIPPEIDIQSSQSLKTQSFTEGVEDSKAIFTMKNVKTVVVSGAFSPALPLQKTEYPIEIFSVYITNLLTPRSTEPTSSFKVRIYDKLGFLQYKKESLAFSQVAQAKPFERVVLLRSSSINGIRNVTYDFTLNTTLPLYRNEFIKLVPPASVTIRQAKGQCQGFEPLLSQLSCSVNNGSLFIIVSPKTTNSFGFPAGTTLRFTVSSISNPVSLEPTESWQVFTTSSRQYEYAINQMTNGLSIGNTKANRLLDVQIVPDTQQLGILTNYTVYFTTATFLGKGTLIELEFPKSIFGQLFNTSTVLCNAIQNLEATLTCQTMSPNIIQIQKAFIYQEVGSGQQIAFRVRNVRNPVKSQVNASEEIVIRTLTPKSYLIDSSENIGFKIGCVQPCNTCQKDQTTCTSCQQSLFTYPLFLYGSACGKNCPIGYYDDRENKCQKCSYPCQTCYQNASMCTSCLQSSGTPYLNPTNQKCYASCPQGTFPSKKTLMCEACDQKCRQCSDAPNKCVACPSGQYIWGNQCYGQCPATSVSLAFGTLKSCSACKKPCQTCSIQTSNCTSCSTSTYLFKNTCLESCPKGYLPDQDNQCTRSDETTYPFLSFILTGSILLAIFASKRFYPNTNTLAAFLSLQSVALFFLWTYQATFLIRDGHRSSFGLLCISLLFNVIINLFWLRYSRLKLCARDPAYRAFSATHPLLSAALQPVQLLFSFHVFRLPFSRLFRLGPLSSLALTDKTRVQLKLNRYSLVQLALVHLPVMAASAYNLRWTWPGRQVFWVDCESMGTTAVVAGVVVVEIIRSKAMFTVEDKYEDSNAVQAMDRTQIVPLQDITNLTQIAANGPTGESYRLKQGMRATTTMITDLEGNQSLEGMEAELEEIVGGQEKPKIQHRAINEKQYVTLGVLQGATKGLEEGDLIGKHQGNLQGGSQLPRGNKYQHLPQDTTRTLIEQDLILDDLDYTSAPIGVDKFLEENSPARRKHSKFLQTLAKSPSLPSKSKRGMHGTGTTQQAPIVLTQGGIKESWTKGATVKTKSAAPVSQHIQGNLPIVVTTNQGEISSLSEEEGQTQVDLQASLQDEPNSLANLQGLKTLQARNGSIPLRYEEPVTQEAINTLLQDLIGLQLRGDQEALQLRNLFDENELLLGELDQETSKKEELQIVVEYLSQQVAALLKEFNIAAQSRDDELAILENGNFTSNEEDMGITPNQYNKQNSTKRVRGQKKGSIASLDQHHKLQGTMISMDQVTNDDDEIITPKLPQEVITPLKKLPTTTKKSGSRSKSKSKSKSRSKSKSKTRKEKQSKENGNIFSGDDEHVGQAFTPQLLYPAMQNIQQSISQPTSQLIHLTKLSQQPLGSNQPSQGLSHAQGYFHPPQHTTTTDQDHLYLQHPPPPLVPDRLSTAQSFYSLQAEDLPVNPATASKRGIKDNITRLQKVGGWQEEQKNDVAGGVQQPGKDAQKGSRNEVAEIQLMVKGLKIDPEERKKQQGLIKLGNARVQMAKTQKSFLEESKGQKSFRKQSESPSEGVNMNQQSRRPVTQNIPRNPRAISSIPGNRPKSIVSPSRKQATSKSLQRPAAQQAPAKVRIPRARRSQSKSPSKSKSPSRSRTKSRGTTGRTGRKRSPAVKPLPEQDADNPTTGKPGRLFRLKQWKAKNNLKDLKDEKDQARKYLKSKKRRRFLKKKAKKSKKGKRKKKGGKKKRKGGKKKKGLKKKAKIQQAKVAPMPLPGLVRQDDMKVEKSALELLDQSSIPLDSAILDTVNYEDDNDFQDIDQLSQSLTHSEFLNLLEEDYGAFILEDVTDRLKETYHNEMVPDLTNEKGFQSSAKKVLKKLARDRTPEQRRQKLKGFIKELEEAGKDHFIKWMEDRAKAQDEEIEENIEDPDPDMFDQAVNDTFENDLGIDIEGEIDSGLPTVDGFLPKSRVKKKRKTDQRSQRSYDAYFNYLPFERAVIQSRGKVPYSNRDAEQIMSSKQSQLQNPSQPSVNPNPAGQLNQDIHDN